jgi:hypothetical protein
MKNVKYENVLWAVVVISSLAEALCGKKFMKRIKRRLRVLDKMAEVEVWVGAYNMINPEKSVSTGNSAFAHSPIVKAESRFILEKLESKVPSGIDTVDERMKKIIDKKLNRMQQLSNNK